MIWMRIFASVLENDSTVCGGVVLILSALYRRPQFGFSDDEDDEKRVVRSQKDKRYVLNGYFITIGV